jgi:hypothetical protein
MRIRLVAVVCKSKMADSFFGGSNDHFPEGSKSEAVIDLQALTAVFINPGRHSLDGNEQIVKTAGAAEAGFIAGFSKRNIFTEQFLGIFDAQELQEFFRTDTGPFFEHPLEMKGAQADLTGQIVQVRLRPEIRFQVADGFFNPFVICHDLAKLGKPRPQSETCAIALNIRKAVIVDYPRFFSHLHLALTTGMPGISRF